MKLLTLILAVIANVALLLNVTNAQTTDAQSITPLAKTSVKANKHIVEYDAQNSVYNAYYATLKGKGKVIIDTYTFDKDLKLVNQKSEECEEKQSNEKIQKAAKRKATKDIEAATAPIREPLSYTANYITIIPGGGAINTKLKMGKLTVNEIWDDKKGDFVFDYTTTEGDEIKLKADDRRITGEFSIADEHDGFINPGIWSWQKNNKAPYETKMHAPKHIVTVMGSVSPKVQKTKGTKDVDYKQYILKTFVVNNTVDLLREHTVNFTGPKTIAQKILFPDGTMGVIFAPHNKVSQLGFDASILYKPRQYTFMRFGIDGSTIDSIDFNCPVNAWKPNLVTFDNQSVYIAGAGSNADTTKYCWEIHHKHDNMVVMKITSGKLDFITAVPKSEFASKTIKPAAQKKAYSWDGDGFYNQTIETDPYGNIYIIGQVNDKGKNGDLVIMHFNNNGKLNAQFTAAPESELGTTQKLFNNPNSKTLSWMLFEPAKVNDKGQKLCYVRMTNINPETNTIGEFAHFGTKTKEQKTEFYLDQITPMFSFADSWVLFGADEDNKNIWLCKIKP